MRPLSFSDSELDVVSRMAGPLVPSQRAAFLEALAVALAHYRVEARGPDLLFIVGTPIQRRFLSGRMKHAGRLLEWYALKDSYWQARTARGVLAARYRIRLRRLPDGDVYDVHRLVHTGPAVWRRSYVGSGLSLGKAQAIAQENYERLQTSL